MKIIKSILTLFFLGVCFLGNAQTVSLPNQLSQIEIVENQLNGISYQEIKRKDWPKKHYKSTAFFISKNFLLTSAHNLKKTKGHSVIKITLAPSLNGTIKPYGSITFNVKDENYYKKINRHFFKFRWRKRPHDMALIYIPDSILNRNKAFKKITYLPLLPSSEKIQKGDTIYCVGYPATDIYVGKNVMTIVQATIRGIYNYHFTHRLKTHKGNSGSPIMVKRNEKFYVIGINSIFKNGTWLNKKRQILIQKWMLEFKK